MIEENITRVMEFILLGFSVQREVEILLFLLILVVYALTLVGNIGMISLNWLDPHLHTPMYVFLSNLAFVDFCYSLSIAPKFLETLLTKHRSISFYACAAQLDFFLSFLILEMFLLAVMAYDRYVAICNPLLYTVIMSQKVCVQLVAGPYLYSFSVAFLHTVVTFRLIYCGPNVINHFYCDDVPLMALACSDTSLKEILIFIFAGFNMISSLTTVLISYLYIVAAILRIQSAEGRHKAFSTCGSHLTAVTIFYGTLIFMYLQPKSNHSLDTDKMASVFYTIVIPMLNPMIYSLRNQEVKNALRKAFEKCYFLSLINIRMKRHTRSCVLRVRCLESALTIALLAASFSSLLLKLWTTGFGTGVTVGLHRPLSGPPETGEDGSPRILVASVSGTRRGERLPPVIGRARARHDRCDAG
ncbi:olfactory receptor 8U3-like [Muntiacus reevesi]|uniref:olfactory receptor 8U3-like n=1 Tax=Muntiacus reevesi TaxID=9886 RepID=UPI003306C255